MTANQRNDDLFIRPNPHLRGRAARLRRPRPPGDKHALNEEALRHWQERQVQRRDQIVSTIEKRSIEVHFQPIVDLRTGRQLGLEALSRFTELPTGAPDRWFAAAASVGLGVELELLALSLALEQLPLLPPSAYLSLNASVATITSAGFRKAFADVPAERIILELTDHTQGSGYPGFEPSLLAIRRTGVKLAIDDTGAGNSGLEHILRLKPDIIKLDIGLTRGIDKDPARRALGRALLTFGFDAYGATFVAEGIETQGEFDTLRSLGCLAGQGYYLGRPQRIGVPRWASIAPLATLRSVDTRATPDPVEEVIGWQRRTRSGD